jgi:chromosome partitioning protein
MRTVTVAGAKGGTAKTTTVLNLAAALAAQGHRVGIADCDPQSTATLGMRRPPVADPLHATPITVESAGWPNACLLLSGGRTLVSATRAEVRAHLTRRDLRDQLDVLLVDTVPAVSEIVLASLDVADLVVVPFKPEPFSVPGLADMVSTTRHVRAAARVRALATMVQDRRGATARTLDKVEKQFGGVLYRTQVPDDAAVVNASERYMSVVTHTPRSRAAAAYLAVAAEVAADLGLKRPRAAAGAVHAPAVPAATAPAAPAAAAPKSRGRTSRGQSLRSHP